MKGTRGCRRWIVTWGTIVVGRASSIEAIHVGRHAHVLQREGNAEMEEEEEKKEDRSTRLLQIGKRGIGTTYARRSRKFSRAISPWRTSRPNFNAGCGLQPP